MMVRKITLCALVLGVGGGLAAQPAIGQSGVFNAASLLPLSLAGGAIGRGVLFTISGVRLSAAGQASVALLKNGVAIPVTVVSATDRRIDARISASAPLGPATLVVTSGGKASRPYPLDIAEFSPGLFSRNGQGWGPAIAQNLAPSGTRTSNSFSRPARPGQTVVLEATGVAGVRDVTVSIGNRTIRAQASQPAGGRKYEEISFAIPADVPQGCFVPVYILASPTRASNVVTVAIQESSKPCFGGIVPAGPSQKIGVAAFSRTQVKSVGKRVRPDQLETTVDDARISFVSTESEPTLAPLRLLPPPGACTAYASSFQANAEIAQSITTIVSPEGRGLDAGTSLQLTRGDQTRSIGQSFELRGRYRARLGTSERPDRKNSTPLFLSPGEYVLSGKGGKDIRGFTARFALGPPIQWTDRDQIERVDRGRGVTLHWKAGSLSDSVILVARNVDQVGAFLGMVVCTAPQQASQFTIPAALLGNVPASSDIPAESYDELAVAAISAPVPIRASGLQSAWAIGVSLSQRFVRFQ